WSRLLLGRLDFPYAAGAQRGQYFGQHPLFRFVQVLLDVGSPRVVDVQRRRASPAVEDDRQTCVRSDLTGDEIVSPVGVEKPPGLRRDLVKDLLDVLAPDEVRREPPGQLAIAAA